jgi:hypothetical protein
MFHPEGHVMGGARLISGSSGSGIPLVRVAFRVVPMLVAGVLTLRAEPAPPSPFGSKPRRNDARKGVVVLSTGERIEGWITTTRNSPFRFKDDRTGENYEWALAEIRQIQIEARETVEPDWRWKESGSDEKIFTGYFYRQATFVITVVTESGERRTGHWRTGAPLTVQTESGQRKFLLHNERKAVDEKKLDKNLLPPLLFVREVSFQIEEQTP